MSWPKPEIIPVYPPTRPRRWLWITLFITLILITFCFLALFWPDETYFRQFSFWLALVLIPAIVGGTLLSIRFYLFGLAQERYEIWQQERSSIDNNWQNWAMQPLNVLSSYIITPNELSAKNILLDGPNLAVKVNQKLDFSESDDIDYQYYFEDLFSSIKLSLSTLPSGFKLAINLYSSSQAYGYFDDDIREVYRRLELKPNYTFKHQLLDHTNAEKLVELIDDPKTDIQLLIINNLQSSGSAFLSAFLLVDPQIYPELNQPEIVSTILRPMISQDIPEAVMQMAQMQSAIRDVKQLWFGNMDKKQESIVSQQLSAQQISPEAIYYLDSLAGEQTILSYWLGLALCCEMVKETKQTGLVVTASTDTILFSVITKGNEA